MSNKITAEAYWMRWIGRCVISILTDPKCPDYDEKSVVAALGLLRHIQKHAGKDLDRYIENNLEPGSPEARQWSASMHNLLAMFDAGYLNYPITHRELIEQLLRKYNSKPGYTPPPTEEYEAD